MKTIMTIISVLLFVIMLVAVSYFSSFKKNEIIADHIELESALRNQIEAGQLHISSLNKQIISHKEYIVALELRVEMLERGY